MHDEVVIFLKPYDTLIELQLQDRIRSIGVNRFNQQRSIVDYCRQYEICLMCYSSLARRQSLLHPFVIELPRKYQRKPAQILFR
ncbi:unnamed protein product [Rotaria sordida]|uniref:Uncharacterized protein n=1 Tax=Rotaria sordida TaxID=392033 RepID=A0A813ZSP6_9BILA|nr:unnamed protein product [Rotaria sordida]CAF0940875.1 unnamed protein product [Rotaria sordida]